VVDREAAKVAEDRAAEIAAIVRKAVVVRQADAASEVTTGVAAIAIVAVSKARRKSISKN
jgi:hypothetical protein